VLFLILLNALLKTPKAHANFNKSSFYHWMFGYSINELQTCLLHFDAFWYGYVLREEGTHCIAHIVLCKL
jgi:hypothetical protein